MVIKTYSCKRCRNEADYSESRPRCKTCGSFKLSWVPKGGHIGKVAKTHDSIFRRMADTYGLTNLKNAREGECMAPSEPALRPYDGPGYMGMPLQMNNQGQVVGSCQPIPLEQVGPVIDSMPAPERKVKMPSLRESTIVEARWSKEKGEQPGNAA